MNCKQDGKIYSASVYQYALWLFLWLCRNFLYLMHFWACMCKDHIFLYILFLIKAMMRHKAGAQALWSSSALLLSVFFFLLLRYSSTGGKKNKMMGGMEWTDRQRIKTGGEEGREARKLTAPSWEPWGEYESEKEKAWRSKQLFEDLKHPLCLVWDVHYYSVTSCSSLSLSAERRACSSQYQACLFLDSVC